MDYWQNITRSFRIAWDHKYLWLIALFSGETGGTFSYNYSQRQTNRNNTQDFATVQHQVSTWVNDHLGLLIVLAVLWLVLAIPFFIRGGICEGAPVRASAEHDAERPFGLAWAWRAGLGTMWVIVRFRLILLALVLPLLILVFAWSAGLVIAIVNGNGAAVALLALAGILLFLVGLPYGIYVSFLDRYGSRAVVLEQVGATVGLSRANRLLFKRFSRSLLVWLLAIVVSLVMSIVLACVLAIVFLPLILAVAVSSIGGSFNVLAFVLILIPILPIALVVQGFLSAQSSTYWTVAFRRLDLDLAPQQYYYQGSPPPPPQVTRQEGARAESRLRQSRPEEARAAPRGQAAHQEEGQPLTIEAATVTPEDVERAARDLRPYRAPTPLQYSRAFTDKARCHVHIKIESIQPIRAFKVRGALNRVMHVPAEQRRAGVITASAGNHGMGVAYAASTFQLPATVYVRS